MKEVTIDDVTYVPVMHETLLDGDSGKCKNCVGIGETISKYSGITYSLCTSLPACWDEERSCHFVVKPDE